MNRSGSAAARRLARLEERVLPDTTNKLAMWPDWTFIEQAEDLSGSLDVHAWGGSTYEATDREVAIAAALHALAHVGEEGGEHEFPSGMVGRLVPDPDASPLDRMGFRLETPRPPRIEDLPAHVGRLLRRMDPAEQPAREKFLHESRYEAKARREAGRRRWEEYVASGEYERYLERRKNREAERERVNRAWRLSQGLDPDLRNGGQA